MEQQSLQDRALAREIWAGIDREPTTRIRTKDVAQKWGVGEARAARALKLLVEDGHLVSLGRGPMGGYALTDAPTTRYRSLAATLGEEIAEMTAGAEMPTVRETQDRFGVPYGTAHRAYDELVSDGLLVAPASTQKRYRVAPVSEAPACDD